MGASSGMAKKKKKPSGSRRRKSTSSRQPASAASRQGRSRAQSQVNYGREDQIRRELLGWGLVLVLLLLTLGIYLKDSMGSLGILIHSVFVGIFGIGAYLLIDSRLVTDVAGLACLAGIIFLQKTVFK